MAVVLTSDEIRAKFIRQHGACTRCARTRGIVRGRGECTMSQISISSLAQISQLVLFEDRCSFISKLLLIGFLFISFLNYYLINLNFTNQHFIPAGKCLSSAALYNFVSGFPIPSPTLHAVS